MLVSGRVFSSIPLCGKSWINLNRVCLRLFSLSTDNVSVETNRNTGCAVLKIHGLPVNKLTRQLVQDMTVALKGLEKSECKTVIITSSISKVFCSGMDFNEMVNPNPERLAEYLKCVKELIGTIYTSKFSTISAVNGAAIGGGGALALVTDYRIMIQQGSMGFVGVAIGVPLESWLIQLCANAGGMRNAELACLTGELMNSEKALKWGFVDEVAADSKDLMERAERQAKIYSNIPNMDSYYITKMEGRKPVLDLFRQHAETPEMFKSINSTAGQNILTRHFNRLKQK